MQSSTLRWPSLLLALATSPAGACLTQTSVREDVPPGEAPAPTKADGPDIVITAQRVAGTAIGTVEPLAVLDSTTLSSLGVTNMGDLVKRLKGLTTAGNGSEPVMLLNGRRTSGGGDIWSLPPEAIERVEILPEQEAARFGYPATMRVMNFITKKHFRSLTLQQNGGSTTEGGGGTQYAELSATRIEGPRRAAVRASYLHLDPLLQSQRAIVPDPDTLFAAAGNVGGRTGASIDPALDRLAGRPVTVAALPQDAAARQQLASYVGPGQAITDIGAYRSLQNRTDTVQAEGTLASPLGRKLDGSINLSFQADRSSGLSGLASGVLDVPAGTGVLPFSSPVLLYRAFPGVVLHQATSALTLHAGTTLQGSMRRWSWSVTTGYDRVASRARSENGVPLDALQAVVTAGSDPLTPLDAASARQRLVANSRTSTNTVATKAVVNGPLARLPAGDAQLTVSADYTRSSSSVRGSGASPDGTSLNRAIGGASVNTVVPLASASEGVLPFLGQMSLSGMIGVSAVSRFGRLLSSNYGFTWAPVAPLQITGSITDTRTPPAIALLVSPTFTTPNTPFFDFTAGTSVLVSSIVGGNAALRPERRQTATIGIAIKPIKSKELRLGVDYLDVKIDNQSAMLGSLTPAFQAAFPGLYVRDSGGALVSVDLRPVNLARETDRKLRMTLNLQTALGRAPPPAPAPTKTSPPPPPPKPRPMLFVSLTGNYRLQDRLVLRDGTPALDLLDGATIDGTGGRPRWDVDGTIGGSYGAFNLGVYSRLQGPTRIRSTLAASDLRFSGRTWLVFYTTLDLAKVVARPWSKQMTLHFTVENLLNDRIAVRDATGTTPNRFQSAYLDPLGRSIRFGARKLF
ncbi:TonB-dependent receptor [Sphingomonas sp. RB3P16]|uniref:TonB-dependent receptor n=1 Tax=Parasphingomonas frigoris TaxID=3096163 RepID=UPI002FCB52E6